MKLSKSNTVLVLLVFPIGNASAKKLRTKISTMVTLISSEGYGKAFIKCVINSRLIQTHFRLKHESLETVTR